MKTTTSEKRSGRWGVLAEHLFSTLFPVCVDVYTIMHSAHCWSTVDRHLDVYTTAFRLAQERSSEKSPQRHPHGLMLFYVFWAAQRATLMHSMVLTVSLSGVGGVSLYVLDLLSLFVTLDTDPW